MLPPRGGRSTGPDLPTTARGGCVLKGLQVTDRSTDPCTSNAAYEIFFYGPFCGGNGATHAVIVASRRAVPCFLFGHDGRASWAKACRRRRWLGMARREPRR